MTDDDLRTVMLSFRESVSDDLDAQQRQISDLRSRLTSAETAILNELVDLGKRMDRRMDRIDGRLGAVEDRLNENGKGSH